MLSVIIIESLDIMIMRNVFYLLFFLIFPSLLQKNVLYSKIT